MKKATLLVIVSLIFTACTASADSRQDERFVKDQGSTGVEDLGSEVVSGEVATDLTIVDDLSDESSIEKSPAESDLVSGVDCFPDGIHPIGLSIAEQFSEITTYQEVMNWFCSGAEFEDILNALMTEELSEIEAENFLKMIADGNTWDDIWLELGITEQ
jgi:hypothetical protein